MAFPPLAAPPKRARDQRATLVFIDECGLMLHPLVRRTLAPRGQTPKILVRGRRREKVSVIAALTLSPLRRRLGMYFRTVPNGSFNGAGVAAFLRQLLRHVRGKVVVIWDRWSGHRGPHVRAVLAGNPRLTLEQLPTYAPVLNPVEHLWSHLKWSALSNFAPQDHRDLDRAIHPAMEKITRGQSLLLGFWRGARLRFPHWLC